MWKQYLSTNGKGKENVCACMGSSQGVRTGVTIPPWLSKLTHFMILGVSILLTGPDLILRTELFLLQDDSQQLHSKLVVIIYLS